MTSIVLRLAGLTIKIKDEEIVDNNKVKYKIVFAYLRSFRAVQSAPGQSRGSASSHPRL